MRTKSRHDALRAEIEWEELKQFEINGEVKSYKEIYLGVLFDLVSDNEKALYEERLAEIESKKPRFTTS